MISKSLLASFARMSFVLSLFSLLVEEIPLAAASVYIISLSNPARAQADTSSDPEPSSQSGETNTDNSVPPVPPIPPIPDQNSGVQLPPTGFRDNPLSVGPPRLPAYVVEVCERQFQDTGVHDREAQVGCLARMGFSADSREPIDEQPKQCDLHICNDNKGWEWTVAADAFLGQPVWYRTSFSFSPTGKLEDEPNFEIHATTVVDLQSLQLNFPLIVQQNIPPNTCEANTKSTGIHEEISDGAYVFHDNIRTDLRYCFDYPCVPDAWNTCHGNTDVGTATGTVSSIVRVRTDGENLIISSEDEYVPGSKPENVEHIGVVEDFLNYITGSVAHMGNNAKYDRTIRDVEAQVAAQSGELMRKHLSLPAAEAFKPKIESATFVLEDNRLRLIFVTSGEIPFDAVCDIRQELQYLNRNQCGQR